jgi:hypothetical protein
MGLAWITDDAGRPVADEPDRDWPAGPRHRRPTLLARSGQLVAGRLTALAGAAPDPAHHRASGSGPGPGSGGGHQGGPHPVRRASLPARRYWA